MTGRQPGTAQALPTPYKNTYDTFDAIVTRNHADGERIRPTIWPTPVLNEGDDLAFDILGVASPDPGSDLTVVIQT